MAWDTIVVDYFKSIVEGRKHLIQGMSKGMDRSLDSVRVHTSENQATGVVTGCC